MFFTSGSPVLATAWRQSFEGDARYNKLLTPLLTFSSKWLEQISNPNAFPSEEAMTREEMRMHESLMAHAAAQMRRDDDRTEKAAERAEAAADRSEEAKAGHSTINNTTNNNTNNTTNNIHIHTERQEPRSVSNSRFFRF